MGLRGRKFGLYHNFLFHFRETGGDVVLSEELAASIALGWSSAPLSAPSEPSDLLRVFSHHELSCAVTSSRSSLSPLLTQKQPSCPTPLVPLVPFHRKGQLKNDGSGCTPVICMCLSLTHVAMNTQCSFVHVITLPISAYSMPLSVDSGQFLIVGSLFISWLLSGFCHFVWLKQWKLTACLLSDL